MLERALVKGVKIPSLAQFQVSAKSVLDANALNIQGVFPISISILKQPTLNSVCNKHRQRECQTTCSLEASQNAYTTTLIHTYNYIHINTNTITNIHTITIQHIQNIHARQRTYIHYLCSRLNIIVSYSSYYLTVFYNASLRRK